jgi:hypothetical protein
MRSVGCIVAPMATTKPFHLTVSLRPRPIFPSIRQATFKVEKKIGFRYFEYGENVEIEDMKPISETMEAVLNLISPARALTEKELSEWQVCKESGWLAEDDLEPLVVEEFLNTYGQIGLANYYRRETMNNLMTPQVFIAQARIPYKYLDILKKEDSAIFRKRIRRIWSGEIIPLSWVEDDLRRLAKCIRMKVAIDKNRSEGYEEISLTHSKQLRRMIHAWGKSGLAIPFHKDSGEYLPQKSTWLLSERQKEFIFQDFVSSINNFLSPISKAITTEATEEISQKNSGIETAICYEIFSRIEPLLERICANPKCKRPFLIQRSTKTYCSTRCADYVRHKEWKARNKKVSAKQAGSKKKKGRSK